MALVAGRNTLIKIIAVLGNVVLARLLSPANFGTVAFSMAVLLFVQLLSDGGLGVGLIRRPEEPHREDLRALLGFQLVLTTTLGALVTLAALTVSFGRVGYITAAMMPALPLLAFRVPSSIAFERSLNYGPLVRVEILEEIAYYVWAVVTIVLGAGVWGLATASVIKALIGSLAILSVSPVARLVPSLSWRRIRPMLGFGIKFQAVGLVGTGGAQLLNIGVAGIGGLAMLGLWTMAYRLLQIPFLLFGTLWRVSYPAAAQLLSAGESARKMIERGLGLAAVATGAILAPATGSLFPLVPTVFGQRWGSVTSVLPLIFFALQASGPISVATVGYLYAVGETTIVLYAMTATSVIWLAVSLPLLSPLGLEAVGLGGMTSALLEAVILSRAVRRRTNAAFFKPILIPWITASCAASLGWVISCTVSHGFVAALLGASVSACTYTLPIVLLRREDVLTMVRLAARSERLETISPHA